MKDDSHLYLDHVQLKSRGWTRNLVKKFLIKPDRWETVDYWANFMGKATYFVERVMQEEWRAEFQRAFEVSGKRRKLTPEDLAAIEIERTRNPLQNRFFQIRVEGRRFYECVLFKRYWKSTMNIVGRLLMKHTHYCQPD